MTLGLGQYIILWYSYF